MSTKYLDYDGLSHFWASIKNLFALKSELNSKKDVQTAVVDPTASGNTTSYIDTISQNTQGVITATKKTIPNMGAASSSAAGPAGLVPAPGSGKQDSFLKGDGTWAVPPSGTDTKNTVGTTSAPEGNNVYLVGVTDHSGSYAQSYYCASGIYTNGNYLYAPYVNGYTLAAACAKGVDSSISSGSSSTNLPTSAAVDSAISTAIAAAMTGASVFKGVINSNSSISGLHAYTAGWYWLIGTAGTYVGKVCEAGDMVYCISNRGSQYSASDFTVVQTNLDIATITNSEIDTILAS